MHVEHVPVMFLGCVLERWQDHRHPLILYEIPERADGLWSSIAVVDHLQLLRQNLHCFAARRKISDRSDHLRSPDTSEHAVCLNHILPPASYPKFSSSTALEEHALLESSTSHRSSLFGDLDGPPSLFCVRSQCSRHVKRHADLHAETQPTPALHLR